ncbi:MAG TPA: metallophosphoesterase [Polyangia bacterium]
MAARFRRLNYTLIALVLSAGVQVPALFALGWLSGWFWLPLVVALLTVYPAALTTRNPWESPYRSRRQIYLVMWPFFAWWTICAVFFLTGTLGLLVAAFTPITVKPAIGVAFVIAILAGLRALSRRPRIFRHTVCIAGLPPAFAGYQIAQISDVHCGPFTPPERVLAWVRRVNALSPDLIAVTGDLITSGGDFVEVVSAALGELRAPDGVWGCMGNHDYFTDGDAFAQRLEHHGMRLLRNAGHVLERSGQRLYLAGVDDTWTHRCDLDRALRERPAGAATVLLAHDPVLFPTAAAHGVSVTLSGHTHGGQLAAPVRAKRWNLARFMTPFTTGSYQIGDSTLYVNRGLGTTGPPIRLGVRPEITLLTLMPAREELSDRLAHLAEEVIRETSEAR